MKTECDSSIRSRVDVAMNIKNSELQLKIMKLLMLVYYRDNVFDRLRRLASPTFFF